MCNIRLIKLWELLYLLEMNTATMIEADVVTILLMLLLLLLLLPYIS